MATLLDREAIAIRAGHHCTQPLHERLGEAATARASFNVYTTTDDIDRLAAGLRKVQRVFGEDGAPHASSGLRCDRSGPLPCRRPMDDLYRDEILEHYRRPHNFGTLDAPGRRRTRASNPLCGDRITLMLDIDDDGRRRRTSRSPGRGCAISQASASMLTDELRGRTDRRARPRSASDDVLELLGIEISPARLKCALLSLDTLQQALAERPARRPRPARPRRSAHDRRAVGVRGRPDPAPDPSVRPVAAPTHADAHP